MARAGDIDLMIDNFQTVADRTPYLVDLKPSGRYYMADLHRAGGIPALLKYPLAHTDLIDGRHAADRDGPHARRERRGRGGALLRRARHQHGAGCCVRPLANIVMILRGNLAPGSAVVKITGAEGVRFDGTARCFDDEVSFYPMLAAGKIKPGVVLIFRYPAPKVPPVCQRYSEALPRSLCLLYDTRCVLSVGSNR